MRRTVMTAAVLLVAGLAQAQQVAREAAPARQPVVEVVFVLDTTGSMGGLIEGAKAKIWHIANQIILGQPKPIVRMGLVGYRDKGDDYVTRVFDLTDNIDQVYKDLMGFQAAGGGDGPENVNQALYDAIHEVHWSRGRDTLRIIYLVGDYPPHNEYQDVPQYDALAKQAIERGIYINTILCGGNTDAGRVWQEIARRAEGEYFQIQQDGGVVAVATPYDAELAELNGALVETVVVYGTAEQQMAARELNLGAGAMSAPAAGEPSARPAAIAAAADRASFAAVGGRAGSQDLLSALEDGTVGLDKLSADELPPEMREMTPEQRQRYVAEQQARRTEINARIQELSQQRAEHIRRQLETSGAEGRDAFDARVVESLRRQAARHDIEYK